MKKYKNIKRTCSFAVCCSMLLGINAFANDFVCNITKNVENNKITFSGTSEPESLNAIQILKSTKDINTLETNPEDVSDVIYTGQFNTDKDGKFEVNVIVDKTNSYIAYFGTKDSIEPKKVSFFYTIKADYAKIINDINSITNSSDYVTFVNNNSDELGFATDLSVNKDLAIDLLYNNKQGTLNPSNYEENKCNFIKASVIVVLNSGSVTNVYPYLKEALFDQETLLGYIKKHCDSSVKAQEYFTSILSPKIKLNSDNITSFDDFADKATEAVILTAVKYPNGNSNIKDIFNEYKNVLGLSTVSDNIKVYSSLAGNTYNSISELVGAYKSYVSSNEATTKKSTGGGSGTGGGGTGSNVMSSAVGDSVTLAPTSEKAEIQGTIGIKFNDLDAYGWAYDSISKLYDLKIVNGYTEDLFRPANPVLREEFVKMLVCTLGLENSDYKDAGFKDVKSGDWFCKYVNIANNNNLVNGMGNNLFGIGKQISRQDMAVMIYKAMISKGFEEKTAELSFDDKNDISDYAKNAVAVLSSLEIINGVGDNCFDPKGIATRAQAAVIIGRALEYLQ